MYIVALVADDVAENNNCNLVVVNNSNSVDVAVAVDVAAPVDVAAVVVAVALLAAAVTAAAVVVGGGSHHLLLKQLTLVLFLRLPSVNNC